MEFKTFFLYFLTSYFICNLLFNLLVVGLQKFQLYILQKQLKNSGIDFLTLNDVLDDMSNKKDKKTWN